MTKARPLSPTSPSPPIAPTQTETAQWMEGWNGRGRPTEVDRKWEVFPRTENNDFGSSQGTVWCSPVPAHEITNFLVRPPQHRLTNKRAPEGFEGNAAGPIMYHEVCPPFHAVHSRSSRDFQAGGHRSGCPWVLGGGHCRPCGSFCSQLPGNWHRHRVQHTCTCMNAWIQTCANTRTGYEWHLTRVDPASHHPHHVLHPCSPPAPSQSCLILTQI